MPIGWWGPEIAPTVSWPTNVAQSIAWASWLLQWCPNWGILPHPMPSNPSISHADIRKEQQKYHEF